MPQKTVHTLKKVSEAEECSNSEVPVIELGLPTERELREENRQYIRALKEFTNSSPDDYEFEKYRKKFEDVTKLYQEVSNRIKKYIAHLLENKNSDKLDEFNDKLDLINEQFDLCNKNFHDSEVAFNNSQIKLQEDLAMTSKKNTVSHSKHSCHSQTRSKRSSLFSLKNLSPEQRLMVAESELNVAQVKVDLAKKLAVNEE